MMNILKKTSLAGLFALLGANVIAAEPILIGLSITQSPPGSVVQGTQVKDAMEIYRDMINSAGGVLGRPIQFVIEDNQGIPACAGWRGERCG